MKRVVLLKSRLTPHGGLEKYTFRIAQRFLEKGADVSILSAEDSKQFPSNLSIFKAPKISWLPFIAIEQFDQFVRKWLKTYAADLVFGLDRNRSQTHLRAGNGVHAAYLKRRKKVEGSFKALLCQINPFHRKILEIEKYAFENPELKKIFTNSHMVKEEILELYQVSPQKIEVIHNGVEWQEMEPFFICSEEKRLKLMQQYHLNPDAFQFLFIGHGYLRKGLDPLLTGLAKLSSRSFELSVIGKDRQMDFYRAKAARLGIQDKVHFFGPRQDIYSFYQLADSLVIPSFYDPFANVTVEALAMGLFVLSSKSNGGYEVLTPLNGAVIEDLFDSESMVDALEKALLHPKTKKSAYEIRQSVKRLDFSHQLDHLMKCCG